MKIEELNPDSRGVEVTFKVIEKKEQRDVTTRDGAAHQVAEFLVGDETGCILLSLWDDKIEAVEIGKVYSITGGYVNVFRNSMRLNTGREGELNAVDSDLEANTSNNVSEKHVENPRQFRGRSGGFRGGSGGRSGGFRPRRF